MKSILLSLLIVGFAWSAGDPAGFHYWSASEMKGFSKSVEAKATATAPGTQTLANLGTGSVLVAHRKGSGQAELHETQADVTIIQSGAATLVYGGEVVDGKTTGPHEIRGSDIRGGMERKMAAGDVMVIPAKTPHLMKLEPGQEVTYMVVKLNQ